ncbi:MAG TPA: phosphoglucomutase/phosphomannomutase family protein [Candidatus Dormibacteraeota bacterium]|nr:phosphoglucomutase/phosphomannomutase family protein [Candidatus Dormibacteraeota bacterium]
MLRIPNTVIGRLALTQSKISFGTDGWRAVVADDFTYANVRAVTQAVAQYLASAPAEGKVVVGHDTRFSAELFAQQVAQVLAANSRQVLLSDRPSPTQVSAWLVVDRGALGGVVVTASHNPPEFNGLKYKPDYGGSASPEVIARLEEELAQVLADDSVRTMGIEEAIAQGLVELVDPRPSYRAQIARLVQLDQIREAGLHLLHDPMYGSGSGYITDLVGGRATRVSELHSERNPGFGGLHPEPIPPNTDEAARVLRAGGFDLGIVNDGDADRVGIFDENGDFVDQLEVATLLLWHLCENRKLRGPVVRSLTMSRRLDILGQRYSCEVEELPVGFKYLGTRMRELDALFAAEESGGFGFRGHIPERDGILSGLFFAEMIVMTGQPLSEIRQRVAQLVGPHAYARRDHRFSRESYPAAREKLVHRMKVNQPRTVGAEQVTATRNDDGYKYWLGEDSWVLVRMSGTEPLMRVYCESTTPERVQRLLNDFESELGVIRDERGHGG